MISQKPFERLLFTFYGIAACLSDALHDYSNSKPQKKMSRKHTHKKKHTKVFVNGMHVLGGWGGGLFDGFGCDDCDPYDEYNVYLSGLGRTQKTSKKKTTTTKTTTVEVVTPKFEVCPTKVLPGKEV